MESVAEALSPELVAALAVDLDLERQLMQAYRMHAQTASSPRLRQAFEQGFTVKRRHESALEGLTRNATHQSQVLPQRLPVPRERLQWHYDREAALTFRYREQARLSEDPNVVRFLGEMATDQAQILSMLKGLYRDFSSA